MNFIRSVTLSKRLALGFGLLLTLLAIIVGVSVVRLNEQAAAMETVTGHSYPKVEAAQTMAYAVIDIARVTRNIILLTDKTAESKNVEVYQKNRETIQKNVAVLDKLVNTDRGRTLLANLKSAGDAYFAFTEDVIALGRKDESKEATALLFGPRYATQGAYLAAVKDVVEQEKAVMTDAGAVAVAAHDSAVVTLFVTAAAAFAVGIACAWLITRSITVPMQQAVAIARSVAAGDLTTVIEVDAKDEAGQLLEALKAMNDKLAGIVGAVRQSSDSIATGSGQIATGNADLSQRTEQQASSLQQTAASMEQMHSTVQQSAETARTATQLAASASAVALRGGEVVAQVVSTMDHISASSKKIADIVGVIDGIAFQTNILALNAAVEAARAGEQGRGFAVVASEVRSLAQRSAESAKQIKSLIAESVETVDSGSRLVGNAGSTMTDIVSQVRRVADLIGEMSASTDEQSKGIGQVTGAVGQLDQVTQQNAALVEESAAAADSLKQQAARMIELVSIFKLTPALLATASFAVARPVLNGVTAKPSVQALAAKPAIKSAVKPAPKPAPKPAAPAPVVATPKRKVATARPSAKASSAAAAPAPAPAPRAIATAAPDQDWESF